MLLGLLILLFMAGVGLLYHGLVAAPADRHAGWLARSRRAATEFLVRAGLREVTPRDFGLVSAGLGLAAGVTAQLAFGWPVLSLVAAAVGLVTPALYYVQRHERRRAQLQLAVVQSIEQLRDSIHTGLSVEAAMGVLARTGPEALREEWRRLVREQRLIGFTRAMEGMQHRLADPVVDVIATALILNDRVGGERVGQVLDRLAEATRAERRVLEEVQALQAQNVLSARVVAVLPLLVLLLVRWLSPEYTALFDTAEGQLILVCCLIASATGYGAMWWIARLPADPRVLTG